MKRQATLDQQVLNRKIYANDGRYERVYERMELLGIQDVTTNRQHRNGTRVWRLPIKNNHKPTSFIEVASFSTGYVRNQNSGYSNYQLNKRCEGEPEYFELANGDYRKFTTKSCKLIPIEIDRLEYLISYCLKNYYIKRANEVAEGKYVSQSYHDFCVNQKLIQLQKVKRECNQAYDCGLSDGKTKANETYSENIGAMARINDLEEELEAMTEDRDDKSDRIYELESQVEVADTRVINLKLQYEVLQNKLSNAISPTKHQCTINKLHDLENKLDEETWEFLQDKIRSLENKLATINRISE